MHCQKIKSKTSMSKLKILIVDDNLLNRKLASAVLRGNGLEHDLAENGKHAFELHKENNYDLILMDVQMPIMNGIDSTRNIRKYEKQNNAKPTPIIAVTTFTLANDKKNCFEAGMNDVLAKPYKTESLLEMISKYLDF